MKKLTLLLIALTTLTNVSYASFPITENVQTEVVESAAIINSPESIAYMILGFFVGFFSFVLFFLPLLLKVILFSLWLCRLRFLDLFLKFLFFFFH